MDDSVIVCSELDRECLTALSADLESEGKGDRAGRLWLSVLPPDMKLVASFGVREVELLEEEVPGVEVDGEGVVIGEGLASLLREIEDLC